MSEIVDFELFFWIGENDLNFYCVGLWIDVWINEVDLVSEFLSGKGLYGCFYFLVIMYECCVFWE